MLGACHAQPPPQSASSETTEQRPASITCPSFDDAGSPLDLSGAFGVERTLSARVERMLRLAHELELAADKLRGETDRVCTDLARGLSSEALDPNGHPCEMAAERFRSFENTVASGGLSVSVQAVECSLDPLALQTCAGECLTGQPGVLSQVACTSAEGRCGLDFTLPNASPTCTTQCALRSLHLAQCSAELDVRLEGTAGEPTAALTALRTHLPRLAALGGELSVRAIEATAGVRELVDELAGAIDELNASGSGTASFVGGAVLAGCVGPRLADALRAGLALEESLNHAARLRHAVLDPAPSNLAVP